MGGFALGGLTGATWGPRLPTIHTELDIGTTTIGLLLSGVTVGAIAGLTLSTPVLHRLGNKRGMLAAIVVIAVSLSLTGGALMMRSLPAFGGAFLVAGFGIGVLDVAINVEGSALEQQAGRTLMPLIHAAWPIGAVVGSGIGAAAAALGVTPGQQFVAEGAIIGAAGVAIARALPATRESDQQLPTITVRFTKTRQWLRAWADWRLMLIGLVMLGAELGEGAAASWLTLAVHEGHGQPVAVAALFFSAFSVGQGVARIFGGPAVDWMGRVNAVRCSTALGVAGLALFILAAQWWAVLFGVLLWSVGASMGFPLGISAAAESGPSPAVRVSIVNSIGYVANLAGPPAIGAVAARAGLLDAMWVVAALLVAAFLAASSLRRPARAVG